jgi:hypothetical protein
MHTSLLSSIRATCPAHLNILDLSPKQYRVRRADHLPPQYVVCFTHLLLSLWHRWICDTWSACTLLATRRNYHYVWRENKIYDILLGPSCSQYKITVISEAYRNINSCVLSLREAINFWFSENTTGQTPSKTY